MGRNPVHSRTVFSRFGGGWRPRCFVYALDGAKTGSSWVIVGPSGRAPARKCSWEGRSQLTRERVSRSFQVLCFRLSDRNARSLPTTVFSALSSLQITHGNTALRAFVWMLQHGEGAGIAVMVRDHGRCPRRRKHSTSRTTAVGLSLCPFRSSQEQFRAAGRLGGPTITPEELEITSVGPRANNLSFLHEQHLSQIVRHIESPCGECREI